MSTANTKNESPESKPASADGFAAPGLIVQMTVERWQSGRVAGEPEELAIWRAIVWYRDELTKWARVHSHEAPIAERFARLRCFWTTHDKVQAVTAGREARAARERYAKLCNSALHDLNAKIAARRAKSKAPPRDILIEMMAPFLRSGLNAVRWYLAAKTDEERDERRARAWSPLVVVSREFPVRYRKLDDLMAEAREWRRRRDGSGSRKTLARYVVAKIAGIEPDSRLFPR